MADISKITLPSGTTYDIKDATARQDIANIKSAATSAMRYVGTTTTTLTDGATVKPIKINNKDYTQSAGDVAIYNSLEFIWSDTDNKWHEFGSTGSLKALAFKDNASGSYTPAGSVSRPTFTGTKKTISSSFTPAGNVAISKGTGAANYTPEGTVTVTPTVEVNTTTVNSITGVGTLPSCTLPSMTATVANENLSLGWTAGSFNAGTLPTKGENVNVATGIKSATATGTFTGTGAELKATFTGTAGTASAEFTPEGNVSQPTFSGTQATITVS